jgi:hypothetical protein
LPWRGSLNEGGLAQVDRREILSGNEIGSMPCQSAERRCPRKKQASAVEFGGVRANYNLAFLNAASGFLETGQAQRFEALPGSIADFKGSHVELVSLSVDRDTDTAKYPLDARFFGQDFIAAEAEQFNAGSELPALRQRYGGANSSIGTWSEPNGDALDLFSLKRSVPQHVLDHMERSCAARFHRFDASGSTRTRAKNRDAALAR